MTPNVKQGLLIGGVALLAVVAVWGWARRPEANSGALVTPGVNAEAAYQAGAVDPNGSAVPANPANFDQTPAYDDTRDYRYAHTGPRVVRPVYQGEPEPQYEVEPQNNGPETHYTQRTSGRRPRSTGKSVAIVAGSAGVGAAVGALAGGGKGAGIGALAGGAGGFIYDRLTHNHNN